ALRTGGDTAQKAAEAERVRARLQADLESAQQANAQLRREAGEKISRLERQASEAPAKAQQQTEGARAELRSTLQELKGLRAGMSALRAGNVDWQLRPREGEEAADDPAPHAAKGTPRRRAA